jgi:hypothetical protein
MPPVDLTIPIRVSRTVSPAGMTALAAVMQVAVLAAGRFPCRPRLGTQVARLVWPAPVTESGETPRPPGNAPSNPTQSFTAGQLSLAFGMAVLVLAVWLQLLHVSGALGR